jgi:hypothetical protein
MAISVKEQTFQFLVKPNLFIFSFLFVLILHHIYKIFAKLKITNISSIFPSSSFLNLVLTFKSMKR